MSVPVDLDALRTQVAERRVTPFLVTTGPDGRPHTVSVALSWDGDALTAPAGTKTARNAAAQPAVCLLWPADEVGDYALICDANAQVHGEGEEAHLQLTPIKAVLHRPAEQPSQVSPEACCRHDCKPVLKTV